MAYNYYNVDGEKIIEAFPGCIPCSYFNNSDTIDPQHRYTVNMTYGITSYGIAKGRLIKTIIVTCKHCNHMKIYNVEELGVYEGDIHW